MRAASDPLVSLVRASIESHGGDLERAILATDDPARVAQALEDVVRDHVGTPVGALLYRTGVGIVAGLSLADGQSVVVKVHRWNVTVARLTAVQEVQRRVADGGGPAPRPLVLPAPVGAGVATVEQYRPGEWADGRDPQVRATIAAELHRFVVLTGSAAGCDVGRPALLRPPDAPLWPEPHSLRFDFDATAPGAAWIDDAARTARASLDALVGSSSARGAAGPDVIGHFDWRVENLGFADGRLVAIYDWDSVAAAPEPVVVGVNAAQFCTDWGRHVPTSRWVDPLPTLTDMQGFVADYETARGTPFAPRERAMLAAANLGLIAYGARCQHSDAVLHPSLAGPPGTGWARLLRERLSARELS